MIKIVTDSSSDLPAEAAREHDITVVPLSIHFGDKTYIDGEDIDAATFYRMLQSEPTHPRTAQPSVGRFEEVYRSLAAEGHEIVTITISEKLSGTHNSAALAARNVPEARVTLIDSHTISMALGALAIRAARMGREGKTAAEIEATVRDMVPRVGIWIAVDTLTYLQRGGRIGRANALLGAVLNVKPILSLRDGEVVPFGRARSRGKALREAANGVAAEAPIEEMYVMHTEAPASAAELAGLVQPLYGDRTVPILPLGPVVGAHVGPGSAGVAALRAKG